MASRTETTKTRGSFLVPASLVSLPFHRCLFRRNVCTSPCKAFCRRARPEPPLSLRRGVSGPSGVVCTPAPPPGPRRHGGQEGSRVGSGSQGRVGTPDSNSRRSKEFRGLSTLEGDVCPSRHKIYLVQRYHLSKILKGFLSVTVVVVSHLGDRRSTNFHNFYFCCDCKPQHYTALMSENFRSW